MTADLGAIRARLAAATPGPWKRRQLGTWAPEVASMSVRHVGGMPAAVVSMGEFNNNHADLDLIAHAPADLAALADEVEALRAAVQRVREVAEGWASRGQHQVVYAEAVPEEVRDALVDAGAEWVNKSRIVLYALDGAS